ECVFAIERLGIRDGHVKDIRQALEMALDLRQSRGMPDAERHAPHVRLMGSLDADTRHREPAAAEETHDPIERTNALVEQHGEGGLMHGCSPLPRSCWPPTSRR